MRIQENVVVRFAIFSKITISTTYSLFKENVHMLKSKESQLSMKRKRYFRSEIPSLLTAMLPIMAIRPN